MATQSPTESLQKLSKELEEGNQKLLEVQKTIKEKNKEKKILMEFLLNDIKKKEPFIKLNKIYDELFNKIIKK